VAGTAAEKGGRGSGASRRIVERSVVRYVPELSFAPRPIM
jgi:hypothetical protein